MSDGSCWQARAEERLARQKHHHEIGRRLELFQYALPPRSHVVAHLARMILSSRSRPVVAVALDRVEICRSGAFASTTTVLPPGSRTMRSGRSRPSSPSRGLLHEVAVVEHARHLDDPPKLDLAPAAAHVRRPSALTRFPVRPAGPVGQAIALTCSTRPAYDAMRCFSTSGSCRPPG